ncbi:hypothetical protein VV02_22285 [Luteipulveratus mongoliensis]|uniref:histidine kinase n=2 Tax=Luteipulveratus mongoliensis TaxID=571913 RepID=A0A0K1JMZ0_9MICO|nr:hypothetical protein VV02_22285 [Luteipulveratus mongoliensis]
MQQTLPPSAVPEPSRRTPGRSVVRRTLSSSAYLLFSWPTHLIGFVLVVIGVALGVSLLILVGGLFVLVGVLALARGLAHTERRTLRHWMGVEAPLPRPIERREGESGLRRAISALRDPQGWLNVVWAVVIFPVSTATFAITLGWWALVLGGLSYPVWGHYLYDIPNNKDFPEIIGIESYSGAVTLYLIIGVLALLLLPLVTALLSQLQAGISQSLLSGRAYLEREIDELEQGRTAGRSAEAQQLGRLERDIHDGPQQRLVRLKMDLARMERRIAKTDGGSEEAAQLRIAVEQTQEALNELRSLSRGIAPPILVDRGLVAAVRESAARGLVPVTVGAGIPERASVYEPHIEQAAYYVISEALANVAKHSGATSASVELTERDGDLMILVTDDGTGGAHLAKGHGLIGLEQRLRSVDGTLTLDSPDGGPTVLGATIPASPGAAASG